MVQSENSPGNWKSKRVFMVVVGVMDLFSSSKGATGTGGTAETSGTGRAASRTKSAAAYCLGRIAGLVGFLTGRRVTQRCLDLAGGPRLVGRSARAFESRSLGSGDTPGVHFANPGPVSVAIHRCRAIVTWRIISITPSRAIRLVAGKEVTHE